MNNLLIDFVLILLIHLSKTEDQKWVWGSSRSHRNGPNFNYDNVPEPASRYEVFEGDRPYPNPYPPDFAPVQRSVLDILKQVFKDPLSLFAARPGGVYGGNRPPNYGQGGGNPGILTGPVPSWVQDGPIKDFDRCKCTEKFNCPSPGISYGHCDVGKQYCCFSTKNLVGGPAPSRPVHSAENGILVGPGGPFDRPGGVHPERPGSFGGRPGSFGGRPGGFGLGNRQPSNYDNGVLVGPGGPFDGPYGRSAKKN